MKIIEKDKEILRVALATFQKNTGQALELGKPLTKGKGDIPQAAPVFQLKGLGRKPLAAVVKKTLTAENLGAIAEQVKRLPQKGILVTPYVNAKLAEKLKAMEVPFLDTLGNAYFNEAPQFIFVKGNKPTAKLPKMQPTRAFQATGLKVLFLLLAYPEWIQKPYRQMAQAVGVALGTVDWVFKDLKRLGFLIEMGKKGRRLGEKKQLLDRWVEAYPEQLRPKLMIGKYRPMMPGKFPLPKARQKKNQSYFWGGEQAAAKLTKYLKPENFTVYLRGPANTFVVENKLQKDPEGNIELLKVFWEEALDGPHPHLVHPLLVYADLLATGDARNREAAGILLKNI